MGGVYVELGVVFIGGWGYLTQNTATALEDLKDRLFVCYFL